MKVWKPKSAGSRIAALLGLIGTIIGIILGVQTLIPDPKPPHLSVAFVLDVSPAMRERLGDSTKLAEAQKTILQTIATYPGLSTSLRLVTAGCGQAYTPPTVDFSSENTNRYRDVFTSLAAQPAASYFEGLNSAASDLATKELIQDSPQKLLMVFVADSRVECGSQLPGFPIGGGLSIRLLWLGGESEGLRKIREQLKDLGFSDIDVRPVGTKKELKTVVNRTVRVRSDTPSEPTTPTESIPTESTTEPVTATVPDVTSQPQNDAVATLEGAGFVSSVALLDVTDPALDGIVLSQDPAGGTQAEPGSTVTITVGRFAVP